MERLFQQTCLLGTDFQLQHAWYYQKIPSSSATLSTQCKERSEAPTELTSNVWQSILDNCGLDSPKLRGKLLTEVVEGTINRPCNSVKSIKLRVCLLLCNETLCF